MANELPGPPVPALPAPVNGTVTSEVQAPPDRSVTTLVSGIIADAQQLIQQQLAMFRQEIRDDFVKGKDAALSLAVGVGLTLGGGFLLLLMLPLLLHEAVPELPLWACFGILGGVVAGLGGTLVYAAVRKLESFNPLSDKSVEAFKETIKWTTNPK